MNRDYQPVPLTSDQNTLLDQLHHSVKQTKDHAINIADSLEEHNVMLDTLGHEINETEARSREQNRSLLNLLKEGGSSQFCVIILVLVLLILLVLFI